MVVVLMVLYLLGMVTTFVALANVPSPKHWFFRGHLLGTGLWPITSVAMLYLLGKEFGRGCRGARYRQEPG